MVYLIHKYEKKIYYEWVFQRSSSNIKNSFDCNSKMLAYFLKSQVCDRQYIIARLLSFVGGWIIFETSTVNFVDGKVNTSVTPICFHELYLVIRYNGNDIRDYHYRLYWYNGKFVIKVGSYIGKIMLHFVLNEKEVYVHVSQGFFYTFSMSKYNVSVYRCIRYDSVTFYHIFFVFTRHVL